MAPGGLEDAGVKESGAVGAIWRDKDIRRGVAGDSLGLEVITSLTPVRSIERGAAKVGFWTPAICGPDLSATQ